VKRFLQLLRSRTAVGLMTTAFLIVVVQTSSLWWPTTQAWARGVISRLKSSGSEQNMAAVDGPHDDPHEGHDHGPAEDNRLELSAQAMANLGLTEEFLKPLELQTFRRTISVPGIVVERPGRTRVKISTPMSALVTHVHAIEGEAVKPGTLLFQLRITAEELVSTQTELLKTLGELDVEAREIRRLTEAAAAGSLSQKTLLERQYAKEKLEVVLNVEKEALRLHGLSERQISSIVNDRRLLRDLQIVVPEPDSHDDDELHLSPSEVPLPDTEEKAGTESQAAPDPHRDKTPIVQGNAELTTPLMLKTVMVHKGETVQEGTTLAELADYTELYIEGRAFEQDADLLSLSAEMGWKIDAVFDGSGDRERRVRDLELVYSANEIDAEARALSFFVRLPNEVARETPSPNGHRYLEWTYRPGQRVQLQVAVEEWTDQIVVPADAVVQDGPEFYVFRKFANYFDRVAVHVRYRDSRHAVISPGRVITAGKVIALKGAHQMQIALKNKSGGAVDPHAGHNH
jgi:cobalt-zinc-cadmium efflux system membrane fusion protein